MSLENKIETLTAAIVELTAQIKGFREDAPIVEQQLAEIEAAEKAEAKPAPKKQPVQKQPDVTAEELQALCMKLVRTDKSNKAKILKLVGAYKGAKTIAAVPADKLPELKAKLEAL